MTFILRKSISSVLIPQLPISDCFSEPAYLRLKPSKKNFAKSGKRMEFYILF